jgi:hypothetical protein
MIDWRAISQLLAESMFKRFLSAIIVLFAAVGCANPTVVASPVITLKPIFTIIHTPKATVTWTPTHSPTLLPQPSTTPQPSDTTSPTSTPAPSIGESQARAPVDSIFLSDGVWRCPDSTDGASFVGSEKSNKFHLLSCEWAKKIKDENRICFADRDAALAYGYIPCGVCKP